MIENKNQPINQRDENIDRTMTEPYARSAGVNTEPRLTKEENQPSTRYQSNTYSTDTSRSTPHIEEYQPTVKLQTEQSSARTGINPGLARALVGGLIGATLGTLAGALASKRTSEGVDYAVKGVGNALKNVGEGLNLAAKGVGEAVKSVGEGASHAVVGSTLDAAQDIAEGAKQTVVGTLDAVQDTAEGVNQTVKAGADRVKDTAEDAKQSTTNLTNVVKDTAEDAKQSDRQSFRIARERLVAEKPQATTSEIGTQEYDRTQTVYNSPPMQEEQLSVAQTTPIDAGMPVLPSEENFREGEVDRIEVNEQTPEI
jgi:stress response protein YsnF